VSRARSIPIALAALLLAFTMAGPACAYDPITWSSIDGGGVAFGSAADFRLGASIGQPDAGALAGGAFLLRGGFWTGGTLRTLDVAPSSPAVATFRFVRSSPNPVRSRSRADFELPQGAHVALTLFDVSGRAVRAWDFGRLPPGHHGRDWYAVDEAGRPLASGVYFLRLSADREQTVQKALVIH